MPNLQGQVNAQRQQQQNLQINYGLTQEQIRNGGYSPAELEALEMKRKEMEDEFFRQLVQNEKYKELGNLQNYLTERSQKVWTQNFDECEKKAHMIFAKFRKLYGKNVGKKDWEERSRELAQLKADAIALTETMDQKDQAQEAIRDKATFQDFDAEIKVMIKKSSDSDSPTYKAVVAVAKEYMDTKDLSEQLKLIRRMQACMQDYAKLRYKTTYGTKVGKRRMAQITKLLAMSDKFLEFQEFIDLKTQNTKFADTMDHEAKHEEAAEFEETRRRYERIATTRFLDERWFQICLPYKRDENGKVTEDTKANYDIDMKFLKAYQSNNTKRQMAAIARIFLKQNLLDYTKDDLTKKNIFKVPKSVYGKDVQQSNKPNLLDFISELGQRTQEYNNLIDYMSARITNESLGISIGAMFPHMITIGINNDTLEKFKMIGPRQQMVDMVDGMLKNARKVYDKKHQPLDPVLENRLRALIAEVDREEQEEKQNPASPEYLKELCRYQVKRKKLYEDKAQALINERYSDHINGENKYWKKKSHLGSLLLPYTLKKDGQVASKSEEFFKYNEKIMPLLHSEDPEDRIAALASVFLRLRKFDYAKDVPTDSTIAEYDKQMLETPGFVSQYQAFGDFLAEEAKRSPDHPMIKYMKKVYENPLTAYSLSLVNTNRYAHGYDNNGTFMNNVELENQSQKTFADIAELATEEMKKQRAENKNQLVYTDETEETRLKQLCENKGLKIFSK